MAFLLANLQPIGASARAGSDDDKNAAANWTYRHPSDSLALITSADYFNEVRDLVNVHDKITIETKEVTEFEVRFFATVPKSPSGADVVLSALKMAAA